MLDNILEGMFGLLIVGFILIIIVYIIQAIFLYRFNKLVYNKGSIMAFLPVFNIYLLGKLTINKLVGFILVICMFITSSFTITINGIETVYTILPESINAIVSIIYNFSIIGLFIYAIIKYIKLKKIKKNEEQIEVLDVDEFKVDTNQQTINNINNKKIDYEPLKAVSLDKEP